MFAMASLGAAVSLTGAGASAMAAAVAAHCGVVVCAVVALNSRQERRAPEELAGVAALRFLARVTPALLVLQVLLGSAYRHKLIGLLPHAVGALTVGTLSLGLGVFAAVGCADHAGIRNTGRFLAGLTAVQILLGIAATLARISEGGVSAWLAVAPAAHVVTGSLTLACAVLLAIQILRNVQVPEGVMSGSRATVAP